MANKIGCGEWFLLGLCLAGFVLLVCLAGAR